MVVFLFRLGLFPGPALCSSDMREAAWLRAETQNPDQVWDVTLKGIDNDSAATTSKIIFAASAVASAAIVAL